MKIDWKQWMQILSNLAILIGLVLVVYELQQTRSLSRAQLASDRVSKRVDFSLALAGENPNLIMTKACLEPNELTPQDKFVVAQIFQARIASSMTGRITENIADLGITYEGNIRAAFLAIFNYEYGKEYFQRAKEYLPADAVSIGEEVLASGELSDCREGSAIPSGF